MINNLSYQETLLLITLLSRPFVILYGENYSAKIELINSIYKILNPKIKKNIELKYKHFFDIMQEGLYKTNNDNNSVLHNNKILYDFKFQSVLKESSCNKNHNYIYLLNNILSEENKKIIIDNYTKLENLNNTNYNFGEGCIKIYNNNNLTKKEISKMSITIGDYTINCDNNFTKFHKKIFKYIIDNYVKNNENNSLNQLKEIGILTIPELLKKGFEIINNEGKINFDILNESYFYARKPDRELEKNKNTNRYFFYKGYIIQVSFKNDNRIKEIKKLYEFLGYHFAGKLLIKYLDGENNTNKLSMEYNSIKEPNNFFVIGTINNKSEIPKNIIEISSLINIKGKNIFGFNENYNTDFLDNTEFDSKSLKTLIEIKKDVKDLRQLVSEKKINETTYIKLENLKNKYTDNLPDNKIIDVVTFIIIGKEILKNKEIKDLENNLFDIAFNLIVIPLLKINVVFNYESFYIQHPLLLDYEEQFFNEVDYGEITIEGYEKLINNIYYNESKKSIFYKNNKLTLESRFKSNAFLIILLEHKGQVVDYNTIHKYIKENFIKRKTTEDNNNNIDLLKIFTELNRSNYSFLMKYIKKDVYDGEKKGCKIF